MQEQPVLSAAEWALVTELLEQELRELPVEIRHTRSIAYHDELHSRLKMVHALLQRLRTARTAEPTVV